MKLDEGEQRLFSKFWGDENLVNNEAFWEDVYGHYSQEPRDAPLPISYTPQTVRMVLGMLQCPSGSCGGCCHYDKIPLQPYDRQRILAKTECTPEMLSVVLESRDDSPKMYMKMDRGNCPFLKDNACTIYEARPDACYMFPIGFRDAALKGKLVQQMMIRIRCPQALAVARTLITESLSVGDKLLLPDLSIIPRS